MESRIDSETVIYWTVGAAIAALVWWLLYHSAVLVAVGVFIYLATASALAFFGKLKG